MKLLTPYISNIATPTPIFPLSVIPKSLQGEVIPFGLNNLFPQELAELYRSSKIHRSTLNNKSDYYTGKEYKSDKYQDLIDVINQDGESLLNINSKQTKDFNLVGNGWIQLVTDTNRSFLNIYHIDTTAVRLDKNRENVLISPNWKVYNTLSSPEVQSIPLFPNFEQDGLILKSVFHIKMYEPEFKNYGIPEYIAGREEMAIDYKTSKYNLSKIVNFFGGNKIVFFPSKDQTESEKFIKNMTENHIGEGKNGKNMYQPYESGTNINNAVDKVQVIDVGGDDKGGWMDIADKAKNDIIMAHNWYRSLMSTGDNTGFNTNMVYQEYQAALISIQQYQELITKVYDKLFKVILGIDLELQIINKPPVDIEIKVDDLMFVWEMREKKEMDFDKTDPNQQITVGEWKSKIKTI